MSPNTQKRVKFRCACVIDQRRTFPNVQFPRKPDSLQTTLRDSTASSEFNCSVLCGSGRQCVRYQTDVARGSGAHRSPHYLTLRYERSGSPSNRDTTDRNFQFFFQKSCNHESKLSPESSVIRTSRNPADRILCSTAPQPLCSTSTCLSHLIHTILHRIESVNGEFPFSWDTNHRETKGNVCRRKNPTNWLWSVGLRQQLGTQRRLGWIQKGWSPVPNHTEHAPFPNLEHTFRVFKMGTSTLTV